jgi:hypothetical protein
VSVRRDQPILVNKAVNEKEQLEKGLEEEEEKKMYLLVYSDNLQFEEVLFSED